MGSATVMHITSIVGTLGTRDRSGSAKTPVSKSTRLKCEVRLAPGTDIPYGSLARTLQNQPSKFTSITKLLHDR